ncbi:uncharacterized protein LOC144162260 isoform X5 [Haemaphysalis longicornis]
MPLPAVKKPVNVAQGLLLYRHPDCPHPCLGQRLLALVTSGSAHISSPTAKGCLLGAATVLGGHLTHSRGGHPVLARSCLAAWQKPSRWSSMSPRFAA